MSVKSNRVYGPSRPPQASSRNRSKSPSSERSITKSSVRDSWMTEQIIDINHNPGIIHKIVAKILIFRVDTLNMKARTFIQRPTSNISDEHNDKRSEEEIDKISDQIQKYNSEYRSKTLQEIYEEEGMGKKKAASKKDQEDRIFDWERDMNSSVRRMSSKSAKDLLNSSSLNDRFGKTSKKYL